MAKYNVQERLDAISNQVEDQVASEMLDDFKRVLLKQFKLRKDHIEDWQDLDEIKLSQLSNRLRVIADKSEWTVSNLLDMSLIGSLLWNEEINGD